MAELATTYVMPASVNYQNKLIANVRGLKEIGLGDAACAQRTQFIGTLSEHINKVSELTEAMIEARKVANNIADTREKAIAYCMDVKEKYFDQLRYHVDKLELLVDDSEWYLPKYRELVFLR